MNSKMFTITFIILQIGLALIELANKNYFKFFIWLLIAISTTLINLYIVSAYKSNKIKKYSEIKFIKYAKYVGAIGLTIGIILIFNH